MLMIQMMRGYEDNLQERNGLKGTGWHYMVANGPEFEWQVGPLGGPVGPGNGIWHA
jgi:hypothetical protein